jgi:hypothetical protein
MTQFTPANSYWFADKGVRANVSTTSISGQPQASITVDGDDLRDVEFKEEETRLTVRGLLSAIPDSETTSAELLLPIVQLQHGAVKARALLIVRKQRTNVGGTPLVEGPLETLRTRKIAGRAAVEQP